MPRLVALGEVLAVAVGLRLYIWWWAGTSAATAEGRSLGHSYVTHTLFVLVALAVILLGGRTLRASGLDPRVERRASLLWGVVFALALAFPCLATVLVGWQGLDVPRLWVSALVFQIAFAGIGEEVLYRGYYQSRLNAAFGRPLNVGGVRVGLGLIATSLLFGLGHLLNPFNPFQGSSALDWGAAAVALQTGLFYGILREKTGSILAPALVHASTFWWDFLDDDGPRYLAMGIGWSIAWVVAFCVFTQKELAGDSS